MELTEKPGKFSILEELNKTVGIPLKFLHVIRNPFDVISTWVLRLFNARLQVNDGTTKVLKRDTELYGAPTVMQNILKYPSLIEFKIMQIIYWLGKIKAYCRAK